MRQHVLSSSHGLRTYYGRPDAGDRHVLLSFMIKVYCHALRQYAHTDLACEKQLVDFVPADVEFCIPHCIRRLATEET